MKPAASETPAPPPPADSILDWARAANRFLFEPVEPTMPCLMRILCGVLLLYVHLSYTVGLLAYVGAEGWGDRKVTDWMRKEVSFTPPPPGWDALTPQQVQEQTEKGYVAWSVWYHVDDPAWVWTLHALFLAAMLCFTLGFATRVSGVVSWVAAISYVNRIPFMTFGMDAMMVIVLTYLLIAPCGALYSIDQWLARKRFLWWRNDAEDPDHPPKSAAANFALRMTQLHFCAIYLVSGLTKLQGASWWSGEAVWGTIGNPNFAPLQSELFMGLLFFLAKHRWLYHVVMGGSVLFTLFVEIGFPFLIWNRHTRWVMVTASVLLHTGIGFLMGLGGFSMYMLVMLMAFIPPQTMLAFFRQLRSKWHVGLGRYAARLRPAKGAPQEELAMQR